MILTESRSHSESCDDCLEGTRRLRDRASPICYLVLGKGMGMQVIQNVLVQGRNLSGKQLKVQLSVV